MKEVSLDLAPRYTGCVGRITEGFTCRGRGRVAVHGRERVRFTYLSWRCF